MTSNQRKRWFLLLGFNQLDPSLVSNEVGGSAAFISLNGPSDQRLRRFLRAVGHPCLLAQRS